jgi:hypothetical protein
MSRNQDRSSALRDGTRPAGLSFCSGSAIRCKRVAQLDPRFCYALQASPPDDFPWWGSVKSLVQDPEFGNLPRAHKNFKKELALFHTGLIWYRNHSSTVDIKPKERLKTMKRYTLRGLIHDAKVFNQLRSEYRRTNRTQPKDSSSGWLLGYLTGTRRRVRA